MDLFPTIMNFAGGKVPENLDGKSLLPVLRNQPSGQRHHDTLVWDKGKGGCWVVRHGKWKLAHNAGWTHNDYEFKDGKAVAVDAPFTYPDGIQLFDLEDDPSETTNLADQHPETVAELTNLHTVWRAQMSKPGRPKN